MSFYTADWVKKLLAEDHKNVQETLKIKGNDFRSYIDATLPFVLYLDIGEINQRVLHPQAPAMQALASVMKSSPNELIKILEKTYIKLINDYATRFPSIDSQELENKLAQLELSYETGGIRSALNSIFKNTVVLGNLTKKNQRVALMFPRFTTIKIGTDFRKLFDYSQFSDDIDFDTGESPRSIITQFLDKGVIVNGTKVANTGFAALQNVGHIEVDIVSSTEGTAVKRGLVSPRLLQALVELPPGVSPEKLTRKFSKETGQATTRLVVRKQFSTSKLVLEMLIENGISIGTLESQKDNLTKAAFERAFKMGAGLTERIRNDKNFLVNLTTSKSLMQYTATTVMNALRGIKEPVYNSVAQIVKTTTITRQKTDLNLKTKINNTPAPRVKEPKLSDSSISPSSLQLLINSQLQDVISANMGDGNNKSILNYRTGRFAASAQVERLTQSREGMITAFYRYMKNPYGTFSDGGRQQTPRSRDPKLLISKSIREIAATIVANRLRAVAV